MTKHSNASETKPEMLHVKILGVGGTGILALQDVVRSLSDVSELNDAEISLEFWALDSDLGPRTGTTNVRFMQLGPAIMHGNGTRGDRDLGRQAALESRAEILELLSGASLVFILAGASGGIGAGATPVIAEMSQALRSAPGYWQDRRTDIAQRVPTLAYLMSLTRGEPSSNDQTWLPALDDLRGKVDSLVMLSLDDSTPETSRSATSRLIERDIQLILHLAFIPGLIGVDFSDVRSHLLDHRGFGSLALGQASGDNRAAKAAQQAVKSASLRNSIKKGTSVLVLVKGGSDLTRYEVNEAAEVIYDAANQEADIIFGASPYMQSPGELEVVVHVTGLPSIHAMNTGTIDEVNWT